MWQVAEAKNKFSELITRAHRVRSGCGGVDRLS